MNKVLGLDIGEKRIGIAVSDALGWTAQGVETYMRKGAEDAAYIADVAKRFGASLIVAGLPLNMNGSEGPSAKNVRDFMAEVEALGFKVCFQDERLTTVSAERMLIEADVSRKKRRAVVDKIAAVYILSAYLDAHRT